ncbi:hypothetical protein BGW36DRAFT_358483 [Talaromyces proteolyticus]|uniref:DUF8004 domain-containing protein n=1 Tax=Talaromyces proteolyticus TaxID=1131652 RepID=A0AAD4KRT3_9EURO|nr:uncharacterized protein BGW36DRAFT_358483 [Talaromyces proteolyticus]KAH8698975.1 hypothetical protein BGW36DRAFT_358483 [Talaromyces proteolyticus]
MLSAPNTARRISSLFNLKTNRESAASSTSSGSPKQSPDRYLAPDHRRARSHSRPAVRHASSPQPNIGESEGRPRTSHGAIEPLDLDTPLPPPPSLLSINQDLDDPGSQRGSHSRQGSRSSSPGPSKSFDPRSHNRRKSWMLGKGSVSLPRPDTGIPRLEVEDPYSGVDAWIAGLEQKIPYELEALTRGDRVHELWNEQGDTFVYLFPQNTQRPPSFRVDSSVFADSPSLTFLARGTDPKIETLRQSTRTLTVTDPDGATAPEDQWINDTASNGSNRMALVDEPTEEVQELHLYLPVPLHGDVSSAATSLLPEDTDTLVLFRNLFAFLLGQALVAVPRRPNLFSILMEVSILLRRFEFSNFDGSNFGEVANSSFANYCDELHLADVRKSREKTIEAVILGENLRYYPLYLEGFVHGVGKMADIKELESSKYGMISPVTRKRLERGYIDLENRLTVLRGKLDEFDFPAMFSGIANSTTAVEGKTVRFKSWKLSFLAFRKHVMGYYRHKFGSWPPKANSKKNEFEESGLNRLLLKEVYDDFTDLYDMLVDRSLLTTRTTDMATEDLDVPDPDEVVMRAMRRMMSEYDRSTPPVLPPIPFDVPQIPDLQALYRRPLDPKKDAKERQRKLKDSEINEILMASYTRESLKPTPFVESFMQFERRNAHGKTMDEIMDNRIGQWLFLYAVLQSLPLLVIDVSDVRFTNGVEYFLCVAPRGGAPWVQNDGKTGRSWFGVAGGQGVVSLPSDVVNNAVDAVYRRSHCWQIATQWAEKSQVLGSPITTEDGSSVFSSPPVPQSSIGSISDVQSMFSHSGMSPLTAPRTGSPGFMSHNPRASIYNGLEALPLPAGVMPVEPPAKPFTRMNPTMSFDDILKDIPNGKKK